MPLFEFEAKGPSGELHKSRIEATDPRHAHFLLTSRKWFVLKISDIGTVASKEAAAPSPLTNVLPKTIAAPKVKLSGGKARRKDVPEKTEQMAQLLRAGMRLSEVLGVLSRRSSDVAWQSVFEKLRSGVVGGKPLSEAMTAHPELFTSLYRSMVAAGEASGHLVEILERLAKYLHTREAVRQQVIGALIYPSIIVSAGVFTVLFFLTVMLPRLEVMFKDMNQSMPMSTQILMGTGNFILKFGWFFVLIAIVGFIMFKAWLKDPGHRLKWDYTKLHLPGVGKLIAQGEYSRFTQTLSTLLQSGVTLIDALLISEATLVNAALKFAIHNTRIQVRDGKGLSEALGNQKIFPGLMLDMLAVGEKTGDLSGTLQYTAETYERELSRTIRTFTTLIEPVLIILMATFVGSIVLSVVMAVLSLTSGIGNIRR